MLLGAKQPSLKMNTCPENILAITHQLIQAIFIKVCAVSLHTYLLFKQTSTHYIDTLTERQIDIQRTD